ncbi:hypothetical protein [Microbulbifer sp. YPW16]|uniref:hypothetical protein n=1 Tax=Microbulbifer sp. YPW16 TaxID=2904242 RepID=UPI001E5F7B6D|nr:hypothetical protein [Microbulbifer sp. YPW16]UHQ53699.1 hypothetical protein LVE68_09240 [Microbulbifer sp. YPW16]
MKPIELLAVGIRICGIMLAIIGLKSISSHHATFAMLNQSNFGDTTAIAYLAVTELAIIFAVSAIFMRFPMSVAGKLLPFESSHPISFSDRATDILAVAFCILGVYILSWALPDLVDNGIWLWYYTAERHQLGDRYASTMITLLVTLVEIAIGLFLSLRSRGFSALLWRLRNAT